MLIRKSSNNIPHRLKIDPSTGKILEEVAWIEGEPSEKGYKLGFNLLRSAVFLPSKAGSLIWIPSQGPVKGLSNPSQEIPWVPGSALPGNHNLRDGNLGMGGWYRLLEGLRIEPIALVNLGDRPMVRTATGFTPVPSWQNYGFRSADDETFESNFYPFSPELARWAETILMTQSKTSNILQPKPQQGSEKASVE
jgi:hypothetical protein